MASQIISLGIGSPASIGWFITLGLLSGAAAAPEPGYMGNTQMQYRDVATVPIDTNIQYRDGESTVRESHIYHRSNNIGGPIG